MKEEKLYTLVTETEYYDGGDRETHSYMTPFSVETSEHETLYDLFRETMKFLVKKDKDSKKWLIDVILQNVRELGLKSELKKQASLENSLSIVDGEAYHPAITYTTHRDAGGARFLRNPMINLTTSRLTWDGEMYLKEHLFKDCVNKGIELKDTLMYTYGVFVAIQLPENAANEIEKKFEAYKKSVLAKKARAEERKKKKLIEQAESLLAEEGYVILPKDPVDKE